MIIRYQSNKLPVLLTESVTRNTNELSIAAENAAYICDKMSNMVAWNWKFARNAEVEFWNPILCAAAIFNVLSAAWWRQWTSLVEGIIYRGIGIMIRLSELLIDVYDLRTIWDSDKQQHKSRASDKKIQYCISLTVGDWEVENQVSKYEELNPKSEQLCKWQGLWNLTRSWVKMGIAYILHSTFAMWEIKLIILTSRPPTLNLKYWTYL